jgi:hypothetical protein
VSVAETLSPNTELHGPPIRPRSDTTWIYFQDWNAQQYIKIGHSRQARGKRGKQNAKRTVGTPVDVKELAEVRGMVSDEQTVLDWFSRFAIDGETEFFRPENELIEYIRWLRDQHYVAVAETTDEERESLPVVDSSEWLPKPERRKPRQLGLIPGFLGPFDLGQREITVDDFYTNERIIEVARALMGRIDLDPASHAVANKVVRASKFYTVNDNGLNHRWHGKVWLNPPFSAWREWVPKILKEWRSGHVDEMCVLSAMRTVTAQYFAPLLSACNAVCIIKGRIRFWGGKAGDSPDDGHSVFYFGQNQEAFGDSFSELGAVFYH